MKKSKPKKIELLAPGGSLEKLKYAFEYGADAVYVGLPDFSLRVRINDFTPKKLEEAVSYAKARNKKIYVTLNIYAHNRHIEGIEKHIKFLKKLEIDGVIVSDPGIIMLVKKHLPRAAIHLSTQANTTNWQAVKFWVSQGVTRIILAREVALSEIKEIKKRVSEAELEYFVHGAMCMSYSGRCILSRWMTGRSANLGDCAQPCRWNYAPKSQFSNLNFQANSKSKFQNSKNKILTMAVEESKGKLEVSLEEDQHGTHFFNSRDLNLLEHIGELIQAGVSSLKIEGRAKSAYYVAMVVRAYRKVLDAVERGYPKSRLKKVISEQVRELEKLDNRGYTKGFLLGGEPEHNLKNIKNKNTFQFVGEVEGAENKLNIVRVHNEIFSEDKMESVDPEGNAPVKIKKIYDSKMREAKEAHGGHERRYYFEFNKLLKEKSLLRKRA